MKHTKIIRLFFIGGALAIAAQYGSNKSVDGRIKPEVNIFGTLTDATGKSYELENILIDSRYEEIRLYTQPEKPEDNPENETTRLDLKDVDEIITLPQPLPTQDKAPHPALKYRGREYIVIKVLFKGSKKTQNTYIIPHTYTIRAEETLGIGAKPLDKEFNFEALRSLKIKGGRPQNCTRPLEESSKDFSSMEQMISTTKRLIEEIENTTQQLPATHNDLLADLKSHLTFLIKELKKTVQGWFA